MEWIKHKSIKELRLFGFAFGSVMTVLGGLLLWRGRAAGPWLLGLAGFALFSAIVAPQLLRPLEIVLATLLRVIMTVVTYVVLTLSYFFVFTPIGWLLKLTGKDLLERKFPTDEETYWVPAEADGPATRPDKPY